MRRALKLLVLLVLAVIATEVWHRGRGGAPAEGKPAPPLALSTLDGRRVDLQHLRGRAVALNFWASWCGPCQQELPELAAFARERRGQCFELVSVAAWSGRDDVARAANDLPFTVLFDDAGEAVDTWKVSGVPRTYVIDPEGRIRAEFRGAVTPRELAAAVTPLVPASCPAPAG